MPDKDEKLSIPITVFITAAASTVLVLDDIAQQPDPMMAFLEELEYQIDETKAGQLLSLSQRDFLQTLFSAFQDAVLDRK